jgi:hypothetical protein
MYFCKIEKGIVMKASDDVSDLKHMTLAELQDLIERMGNMEGEFIGVTKGKTVNMAWADWGKVYQHVHQVALDWYLENYSQ